MARLRKCSHVTGLETRSHEDYCNNSIPAIWTTVRYFLPQYRILTDLFVDYRRSVLILVHEKDSVELFFTDEGIAYAKSALGSALITPSSSDDKKDIARRIITQVSFRPKTEAIDPELVHLLFNLARHWDNVDMWKKVFHAAKHAVDTLEVKQFAEAWKVFGFEKMVKV
jgi:hypothetical protein